MRAAPSPSPPGWAVTGDEADGCAISLAPDTRTRCPWGAWSRQGLWLLREHLPGTPMMVQNSLGSQTRPGWLQGWAPPAPSRASRSPPPTPMFSGALLWLQKKTQTLAVWQELPFTLWGLSKVQRRKCQRRGKGAHCALDLPRAWNNAARKNILSIYTALPPRLQAWPN